MLRNEIVLGQKKKREEKLMLETAGNIWDRHDTGHWVAITTNGTVSHDYGHGSTVPRCIMGRGVALQAKKRYPGLPVTLGHLILMDGNAVYELPHRIYSFPVKTDWWKKASMYLIVRSCKQLAKLVPENRTVYMVRPGCGAGRLNWREVKPEIEDLLDDRFVVVELPKHEPMKNWRSVATCAISHSVV